MWSLNQGRVTGESENALERFFVVGKEFAAGVADVDPKRDLKTCKYCDLRPLCRVHERLAAIEDEDGELDEEAGA